MVQKAGGLLGGAEAAIRLFRSSAYGSVTVAGLSQRVPMGVHKQCGQLRHGPVELLEGPRDAAHGIGGVNVSRPCLQRVDVVVGEADHADKLKVVHGGPAL